MEFKEYHKIPSAYKLDAAAKKYTREFSSKELEYLSDCIWMWTEKIDGTNIRVCWDGHKVGLRGRTDRAQMSKELLDLLNRLFGGPEMEIKFEEIFQDKPAMLVGEAFGPGIQSGGGYGPELQFRLFDVKVGGFWLERPAQKDIAEKLNIRCVPLVGYGRIEFASEYLADQEKTTIEGGTAPIEGLVGVPTVRLNKANGERIIVKIRKEYL